VRGTVDVLIATRCLTDGLRLLHSDRDFDGFERLGLQVVACGA
jgi:predicted nucleic acid-binding protein